MSDSPNLPKKANPGNESEGKLIATRLFRVLNFELFARKNSFVMVAGFAAFVGIATYFWLDNHRYQELQREKERRIEDL